MRKIGLVVLALVLFLSPTAYLLGVTVLAVAALGSDGACGPSVGEVPDSLAVATADGVHLTLDRTQLSRAATIVTIGGQTKGVGRDGVRIALMAALTESSLRMLANAGAYPESARFPNDGDGGDHDSLGLFQMRPSTGWGTVAQLMEATYQARAFFGGPRGPNRGSPRGLLDIPGWRSMSPGAAAQAVEVSAFPDRYARYAPVADAILEALTSQPKAGKTPAVTQTARVVFPLPAKTWAKSSGYGSRTDPVTHIDTIHSGTDYAAPLGTPILAIADGRVVFAGAVSSGYAHLILIEHTVAGRQVFSGYAHMYAEGIHVREGDVVVAGQHIADVGADGKATGPHLHFEIRHDGTYASAIDPAPWLADHGAVDLIEPLRSSGQRC